MSYQDLAKRRETQRKYREKNREKINAYQREKFGAAYMRVWRDERPGQRTREREARKEYYYKNQEEEQRKAREYMRAYYENHKAEFSEYGRSRYLRMRARWDAFVAEQKCEHCGIDDPGCLDFHHADPRKKDFHVSGMLSRRWDSVMAEAKKCIVLCANCHRKEHARLRR